MTINLQMVYFAGLGTVPGGAQPLPIFPPVKRVSVAAAGLSAAMPTGTKLVSLQNKGDAVWVRLNLGADVTTQAASSDDQSIHLDANSGRLDFFLPKDQDVSLAKLDVRAA